MVWQDPKTDWQAADIPLPDDLNRIEGNVQELQNTKETPAGAQAKAEAAANAALNASKLYTDEEIENIPNASTSQKGIVQLSTSTTSTSTTMAATPSAVMTVRNMIPDVQIVTGSYVGNGSGSPKVSQTIIVGFTPDLLFIFPNSYTYNVGAIATRLSTDAAFGINPGSTQPIMQLYTTNQYHLHIVPDIVENGFKVESSSSNGPSLNYLGRSYRYIAIKGA